MPLIQLLSLSGATPRAERVRILVGPANPRVLPPDRNIVVFAAKADVSAAVITDLQRLMLADRQRYCSTNA